MQTYWCNPTASCGNTNITASPSPDLSTTLDVDIHDGQQKSCRMVDWYVETLSTVLEQIPPPTKSVKNLEELKGTPRDQISDEVDLEFSAAAEKDNNNKNKKNKKSKNKSANSSASSLEPTPLTPEVMKQLREFVTAISAMYNENAFHNFEHATHVGMSAKRYLKNIHTRSALTSDPLGEIRCVDWCS